MLTKSKKPLAVSILVVIAWFLITGVFGPLFGKLSTVQENNNSSFLPKGAEATLASDEISKFSAGTAFNFPTLILLEGQLSPEALTKVNAHLESLRSLALADTQAKVGDYLLKNQPIVAFPSEDQGAILINIPLDGETLGKLLPNEEPVLPALIEALREDMKEFAAEVNLDPYVTGPGGLLGDLF